MVNRTLMLVSVAAVLGCSTTSNIAREDYVNSDAHFSFQWSAPREVSDGDYANVLNILDQRDAISALFEEDITHDAVVQFFVDLTGSAEIAMPILYHANREDIPLSLAFSLAYVESRFSPVAVNRNATSTDRGLFQLNSRTFQTLTVEDFFNPDVNAYHGMDYLSWCLRHTDTDRDALAAYNAGLSRVRRNEIPQSTQIYIRRIQQYRTQLESRFKRYILREFRVDGTQSQAA